MIVDASKRPHLTHRMRRGTCLGCRVDVEHATARARCPAAPVIPPPSLRLIAAVRPLRATPKVAPVTDPLALLRRHGVRVEVLGATRDGRAIVAIEVSR